MGVAAVNTGNNLLFLIVSAMLAFMAVTGVLGYWNIQGLSVGVRLSDEVYAGTETLVTVRVENRKKLLPSFLIKVALPTGAVSLVLLRARKGEADSLLVSFPVRGRQSIGRVVISSPFPVNFFIRYKSVAVAESFTVFPAPRPLALPVQGGKPEEGEATTRSGAGYDGDLAKISDYRGGEPLKLIHWRLSAKHEVFKVKELTATADEPTVIDPELVPGRDLEQRLSCCTYLVNRLVKGGRPVGLKLGERMIAPAATRSHRLKLLGELAVYGKD